MADHFSLFSVVLRDVTNAEYAWLKRMTEAIENNDDKVGIPELDDFDGCWAGWSLSPEVTNIVGDNERIEEVYATVYLSSEESFDVEALGVLLQYFLVNFRPTEVIGFEWAYTCSKPRPGEFGGGAMVVCAEHFETFHATEWVSEKVAEFEMWLENEGGCAL